MTEAQDFTGDARVKAYHGVLLTFAAVLPVMAIVTLVPVLPMLLTEFSHVPGAAVLVPVALTLPALFVALLSPVVGLLADRIGRKRMLIGALILYAVVGTLPIILESLTAIIASRALLGVAEATIMTLATTLLGDYYKGPRLDRWVAIQIGIVSLSAILLTGIGGLLGDALGSRGPFYLYFAAIPFAAVAAFLLFEPLRERSGSSQAPRFPWGEFVPLLAVTFGAGLLFYTLFLQLGPVLVGVGVESPAAIGAAGALANVGIAAGSVIFKLLSTRREALILPIGFGLAAAGYAGAALATSYPAVTAFTVMACCGSGMLLPALLARMLSRLPTVIRGRGTGLWNGAFFLAQFAAPILATLAGSAVGGLNHVLLGFAAAAAVASLIALSRGAKPGGAVPAT